MDLDNNTAERAVRPVTLGRKNYLFMGSEAGGDAAAIAYTLIETCKMNNVNPEAWLAWVLERIQDHPVKRINELLPWTYQAMLDEQKADCMQVGLLPFKIRQWDLFGERGTGWTIAPSSAEVDPKDLDDQKLIEQIPKANLSSRLSNGTWEMKRSPGALWRFKGFGIKALCPSTRLALQTLGEIGTLAAQTEIRKILAGPPLPDSLLPVALHAATTAKLNLPLRYITPWLEHEARTGAGIHSEQTANPSLNILETGLSSRAFSTVRRFDHGGKLGPSRARSRLLGELRKNPTSQILQALFAIADEENRHNRSLCAGKHPLP